MLTNISLYAAVVLIWGTTWFTIKFQLGVVPSDVSVGYRFLLSGLILLIYATLTRPQDLKLFKNKSVITWLGLQSVFMFGLNYILVYMATAHLTSALVAVVFSLLTVLNALNARIFLKQKMELNAGIAIILGFVGIMLFFAEDILAANSEFILGTLIALASTYSASLGNIAAVKVRSFKVPIIHSVALGMTIGGALTLAYSFIRGAEFSFVWSVPYVGSLAYLSLFGSIAAFLCYINLLSRIGASRAAYSSVLIPVVAILISSFFENYKLTFMSLLGFGLILIGNVFALTNYDLAGYISGVFKRALHLNYSLADDKSPKSKSQKVS